MKKFVSVMVLFSLFIGSLLGAIPTVKAEWESPKAATNAITGASSSAKVMMQPQIEKYVDLMAHIEEARSGKYRGYVARLYIPDLGIDVALFRADITNKRINNGQSTCDAEDSAVFDDITYSDTIVIADHCYQGFGAIANASPGMRGYIITGNEANPNDVQQIVCAGVYYGVNDLYGPSGVPFILYQDGSSAHCTDGYTFYTCASSDGTQIYINHWYNT